MHKSGLPLHDNERRRKFFTNVGERKKERKKERIAEARGEEEEERPIVPKQRYLLSTFCDDLPLLLLLLSFLPGWTGKSRTSPPQTQVKYRAAAAASRLLPSLSLSPTGLNY